MKVLLFLISILNFMCVNSNNFCEEMCYPSESPRIGNFYNMSDNVRDQFLDDYPTFISSDNRNIYDLNDTDFDKFLGYQDINEPGYQELEDIAQNLVS